MNAQTLNNNFTINWIEGYTFTQAYQKPNLSPQSLYQAIQEIIQNPIDFAFWSIRHTVFYVADRSAYDCSLVFVENSNFFNCVANAYDDEIVSLDLIRSKRKEL
eukprot:Anaeramoba_ignava/c20477_g1_i1.p2 GENE.c20477_g1_i1~~c20477_g1_i1.p2  ORF type:complete len:104 (-),score=41.48 c20477_g1_i1:60-371(-)